MIVPAGQQTMPPSEGDKGFVAAVIIASTSGLVNPFADVFPISTIAFRVLVKENPAATENVAASFPSEGFDGYFHQIHDKYGI